MLPNLICVWEQQQQKFATQSAVGLGFLCLLLQSWFSTKAIFTRLKALLSMHKTPPPPLRTNELVGTLKFRHFRKKERKLFLAGESKIDNSKFYDSFTRFFCSGGCIASQEICCSELLSQVWVTFSVPRLIAMRFKCTFLWKFFRSMFGKGDLTALLLGMVDVWPFWLGQIEGWKWLQMFIFECFSSGLLSQTNCRTLLSIKRLLCCFIP